MIPSMIFALCLFAAGGLWLLVEMFRASLWWGIFGILLPPVQMLFVLVNWGRSWRPLLLQLLGLVVLLVGLLRNPDVQIQEHWYQAIQQTSAALPASAKPLSGRSDEQPALPVVEPQAAATGGKTIYKCKDASGRIAFTDRPCDGASKTVDSLPVVEHEPSSPSLLDTVFSRPDRDEEVTGSGFECDGRTHCSQMTSCEEAKFFLANCPGVKMDGGGDGVPCESQWCGGG